MNYYLPLGVCLPYTDLPPYECLQFTVCLHVCLRACEHVWNVCLCLPVLQMWSAFTEVNWRMMRLQRSNPIAFIDPATFSASVPSLHSFHTPYLLTWSWGCLLFSLYWHNSSSVTSWLLARGEVIPPCTTLAVKIWTDERLDRCRVTHHTVSLDRDKGRAPLAELDDEWMNGTSESTCVVVPFSPLMQRISKSF